MAAAGVCRFFKYGYCRYQDLCRYEHVPEVCENSECLVRSCRNRHPKTCIYYKKFKQCKFGSSCQYKHDDQDFAINCRHHDEVAKLSSEIGVLKETIANIARENEVLRSKLMTMDSTVKSLSAETTCQRAGNLSTPSFDNKKANGDQVNDVGHQDAEDVWITRREALGPAFASFPSWSFKTR